MPNTHGQVIIAPQVSGTLSVRITTDAGTDAVAYLTQNGSSAVTWPYLITGATTFHLRDRLQSYAVSVKKNGLEIASGSGTVAYGGGEGVMSIAPSVDQGELGNALDPFPPMASGRYYRLPNCTLTTSATLVNSRLRAAPKFIPSAITLTRLGAEITAAGEAGSTLRLGIYADDGAFRPGALVLDAGTISGTSATVQEITISQILQRGWYWFAAVVQGAPTTQPTVRIINALIESAPSDQGTTPPTGTGLTGFLQDSITGALPATFVPLPAGGSPSMFGKVL